MLLKTENHRGEERVTVLPVGSIVTYFVEGSGGNGVDLHLVPGLLAFPAAFEEQREAVRIEVINKVAERLGVPAELVFEQPFSRLKSITDNMDIEDPWGSRRRRNRPSGRPHR